VIPSSIRRATALPSMMRAVTVAGAYIKSPPLRRHHVLPSLCGSPAHPEPQRR
jgi:hypothetical protein